MKVASIILILALSTGVFIAQPGSHRPESGGLLILEGAQARSADELTEEELFNPPTPSSAMDVPKSQIPVYYCLESFFSLPVTVHLRLETLDELLRKVGVKPTSEIKSYVLQLWGKISNKEGRSDSMELYKDDPDEWDREQYRLIAEEIRSFKNVYDKFLDACSDEGLDRDEVHESIVEFGREITAFGTSGELDSRHKEPLLLFEEPGENPLLED